MTAVRDASPDFVRLRVADVMTIDPIVVHVDDPLESAERLLAAYDVSGLPVLDAGGNLVGVISRTDIAPTGNAAVDTIVRTNARRLAVGELMSSPAVRVQLTASLVEAARVMHDGHVHRVVVTDDEGRPVGILSASDFVALVAEG